MVDLRWEDPPAARHTGRPSSFAEEIAELKAHPNQWAIVRETEDKHAAADALAGNIRKGRSGWGEKGDFEAVTRTYEGVKAVYVRYVGSAPVVGQE